MRWPLQSECDTFYGNPRGSGDQPNYNWADQRLVSIIPPWSMIDDDRNVPVRHFLVHENAADSLNRVLAAIWTGCGKDQRVVDGTGMHRFSGSWVYRSKQHGHGLSMHSYGAAIDFNANAMPQGSSKSVTPSVVIAFQVEGWVWGGHWSGPLRDPMHFQAARVG